MRTFSLYLSTSSKYPLCGIKLEGSFWKAVLLIPTPNVSINRGANRNTKKHVNNDKKSKN